MWTEGKGEPEENMLSFFGLLIALMQWGSKKFMVFLPIGIGYSKNFLGIVSMGRLGTTLASVEFF